MLLCLLQVPQALFDLAIINAEELIRSGGHVDIVRLSLSTFFINKRIYGGCSFVLTRQSMTWNKVFLRADEPRLEAGTLFCS